MNQIIFQEKYPIYTLELNKSETTCKSVDDIINHFKTKIEQTPIVQFIAVFDHYAHTAAIEDGFIDPDIKDAKNILFCFGKDIKNPSVVAVRPRSIGIVELEYCFIITFLEAPNPLANTAMEAWSKALKNA